MRENHEGGEAEKLAGLRWPARRRWIAAGSRNLATLRR
jgi:hypothetical protein